MVPSVRPTQQSSPPLTHPRREPSSVPRTVDGIGRKMSTTNRAVVRVPNPSGSDSEKKERNDGEQREPHKNHGEAEQATHRVVA